MKAPLTVMLDHQSCCSVDETQLEPRQTDESASALSNEVQAPFVRVPLYKVPPEYANPCEKFMKFNFEPLSIKRTCDDWQNKVHSARNWIPRVVEPDMRIWTNDDGLPFNPDLPLMAFEAYYPDIDDPAILLCGNAARHRRHWDSKRNREIREMPNKGSKQISVEYACSNRTVVSPREYIEKKIYFEVR